MRRGNGCFRWLRYHYIKVLRINDTPEKVAGGLALGVAIGILPSFGLGIVAAVIIAGAVGLNRVSSLIGTLVMNPWTAPFFWALSYIAGSLVLGNDLHDTIEVVRGLKEEGDLWASLLARELLLPYAVGNLIITAFTCATSYVSTIYIVRTYRRARARHIAKKAGRDRVREARHTRP